MKLRIGDFQVEGSPDELAMFAKNYEADEIHNEDREETFHFIVGVDFDKCHSAHYKEALEHEIARLVTLQKINGGFKTW